MPRLTKELREEFYALIGNSAEDQIYLTVLKYCIETIEIQSKQIKGLQFEVERLKTATYSQSVR